MVAHLKILQNQNIIIKKDTINGGKTNLDNIIVVCINCHKKIHGKEKIKLPSKDEILDIDE